MYPGKSGGGEENHSVRNLDETKVLKESDNLVKEVGGG